MTRTRHTRRHLVVLFLLLPLLLIALLITVPLLDPKNAHSTTCTPPGATRTQVGPYGPEQMANAAIITTVGTSLNIPDQGILIALMAAMTESGLRNLNYGDRDSLGLFQMRPSMGWGTPQQLTNPHYAATKFYNVLLTIPNWQNLPLGDAAQAVERSAYPHRYAQHEHHARAVLAALTNATPCQPHSGSAADITTVINAALSQVGVPYAWGGGNASGPTRGTGPDTDVIGYDCSGLALHAYAQIGIAIPHQTKAIWAAYQPPITDRAAIQPGDLILLSNNGHPSGIHHVGIYFGNDTVVHAPQSGDRVKIEPRIWHSAYWSREFIGAVRPR